MFWVVAGIVGVLSGLIASIAFFLLLCKIKPVVVISDDICRDLHDDLFRIKVVNKSKFDLIDVKYPYTPVTDLVMGLLMLKRFVL